MQSNRRYFLGLGLAVAGGLLSPAARAALETPRSLSFLHTHTGETLKATYWDNGSFLPDGLAAIDHILRDFMTGTVVPINRPLLNLLTDLHAKLGSREPFQIISAYRTPATNSMLRSESTGVAKHSYHMKAMAIDIRLADVRLADLRRAAKDLARGGVGMYPASNFVHVDTGPVRYW